MVSVTIRIKPATQSRWPDVASAFDRGGSNPNSCWCQRFRDHNAATNEDALRREIDRATIPVGLLAYDDEHPVGWTRVMPRRTLPGVTRNRALRRLLDDDDSAWWVACVNVQRGSRGEGVGVALLKAAVEHAREHGASVLDGHPVDVAMSKSRPSPAALFTGTVSIFRAAGFREFGRTYPTRPVMRIELR
ncbi:GNAT family N-acetyltransferase [Microbacterium sp. A94]|uniref:GNAT family N-acetyltransferase n=1 Tax=Microbacterium sp. A94 TaxID=3450717 RepID=UPI003F4334AB